VPAISADQLADLDTRLELPPGATTAVIGALMLHLQGGEPDV
jgi:hypothetical protein